MFFDALGSTFYFILCSRGAFPIRCVICFIFSCPPVMCAFMPWFLRFISSCAVGAGSPSGVSYALYFHLHNGCVLSYLGSHVLFYLVQSERVPIRCVICFILSYPTVMVFRLFCSSPDLECSFNHTDKMYNHKLFKISCYDTLRLHPIAVTSNNSN